MTQENERQRMMLLKIPPDRDAGGNTALYGHLNLDGGTMVFEMRERIQQPAPPPVEKRRRHGGPVGRLLGRLRRKFHKPGLDQDEFMPLPYRTVTFPVEEMDPRLVPLFSYLEDRSVEMRLAGEADGGCFAVCGLSAMRREREADDEFPHPAMDRGFNACVQNVIRRLLGDGQDDCLFNTYEELRLLVNVAGGTLRPEILEWAKQNLYLYEALKGNRDVKEHIIRALTYMLNIDWDGPAPEMKGPEEARRILDREFYGLDEVKETVLEVLSQVKNSGRPPRQGILLEGPPGVGKTAIAMAVASVMNEKLVRLDMSSIGDREGLTGSSRIYSNAKPGYVVEEIFRARSNHVVAVINELDKVQANQTKQNPGDALLSLLDRSGFFDNFIECPIPTENLYFIATCNDAALIPAYLLDRFIVITLPAYSAREKQTILEEYVLPRQLEENGLSSLDLSLRPGVARMICREYALEPGVRDLEQYVGKLIRRFLRQREQGGPEMAVFGEADVQKILGMGCVRERQLLSRPGLAQTAVFCRGRAVSAYVEAVSRPGTGKFLVLNASCSEAAVQAQTAYECVACAANGKLRENDLTVMLPRLSVSREGIGVAVYAAIVSALTRTAYPDGTAFLGELDLHGNTLFADDKLDPYVDALAAAGTKNLYLPLNGSERSCHPEAMAQMRVLKAIDAANLIELAISETIFNRKLGTADADDGEIA